jgi:hypothetical protein
VNQVFLGHKNYASKLMQIKVLLTSDGASWLPTWAVTPLGFSSRFLLPTQQLLQEFCSLPWPLPTTSAPRRQQGPRRKEWTAGILGPSSQIQAMVAMELQRLKDKLYIMLEEEASTATASHP